MLKLLVVEGNTKERRLQTMAQSGSTTGKSYAKVLQELAAQVETVIAYPTDTDWQGLNGIAWGDLDGAVITGSGLHIADRVPEVSKQLDFVKEAVKGGVPFFGSCWGMQVLVACAGGDVRGNESGREVGVGRNIKLTPEGVCHPMYEGKAAVFDAVSIHMDHVVSLPSQATLLASNEASSVQAVEIEGLGATCWGVQYHPEFDLAYMANILEAFVGDFVRDNCFPDEVTVQKLVQHMRDITKDRKREDIKRLYGWDDDVTEPHWRLTELRNWLHTIVEPRHVGRV